MKGKVMAKAVAREKITLLQQLKKLDKDKAISGVT
jgi:hypothetical protein